MDRGTKGIDATLDALDAAGLGHTGMARSPEESLPSHVVVNGVRVAHLSYTFGFNGLSLPRAEPWRSNLIEPQRIIAEARQAKADGAEFVVLSLHWGWEGPQRRHARAARPGRRPHPVGRHRPHRRPPRPRPAAHPDGERPVGRVRPWQLHLRDGRRHKVLGAGAQDGAIVRVTVTSTPAASSSLAGRRSCRPTSTVPAT